MTLTDTLRARCAAKNQSVTVSCGALGAISAQGLPLRECAGDDRGVLYAASRDLQAAGEQLRREGLLFRPDEIMQFLSDSEAAIGAEAVRRLSGVSPRRETDGADRASADGADKASPDGADKASADGADKASADGADRASADGGGQLAAAEKVRRDSVQDFEKQNSEKRQLSPRGEETENDKIRRDSVQDFRKHDRNFRRDFVQPDSPPAVPAAADAFETDGQTDLAAKPRQTRGSAGQVSHEFFSANRDAAAKLPKTDISDKKAQSMVVSAPNHLQNVGGFSGQSGQAHSEKKAVGQTDKPGGPGLSAAAESRPGEAERTEDMHEIKSEFAERGQGSLHEMKSELPGRMHEIKSESAERGQGSLHEMKSELPERMHEIKSELAERGQESLHEITSETAEELAALLLRGLRTAAGAR